MRAIGRHVAVLCLGVGTLGACTSSSEASTPESTTGTIRADGPLPTIGLGSDAGPSDEQPDRGFDADIVDSVVMIGDSITVASTPQLEEQLADIGFDDIEIVAQDRKRIGYTFDDNASGAAIAEMIASDPSVVPGERLWIIALGTNDIGNYSDPADVRAVIDSVLEQVPDEAPLIWIDTYVADRIEDTAALNALIEAAIAQREHAIVGDWSHSAAIDGVLRVDGVHPNEQGVITFAGVVSSTAANFLGR